MVNDEKVNNVFYAFRCFLQHKRGSSYQRGKKKQQLNTVRSDKEML